jgi:hypothetical protein
MFYDPSSTSWRLAAESPDRTPVLYAIGEMTQVKRARGDDVTVALWGPGAGRWQRFDPVATDPDETPDTTATVDATATATAILDGTTPPDAAETPDAAATPDSSETCDRGKTRLGAHEAVEVVEAVEAVGTVETAGALASRPAAGPAAPPPAEDAARPGHARHTERLEDRRLQVLMAGLGKAGLYDLATDDETAVRTLVDRVDETTLRRVAHWMAAAGRPVD